MGRKRKNSPNMKVYGVPFRVTEMKATTKGQIRWYVSMREPDGSVLHGENVGKLVTAKNMKAEVVIKATESIIRENGERVLEWLRVGRLKEATPELLLLALPEESIERVYGNCNAARGRKSSSGKRERQRGKASAEPAV